MWKGRLAAYRLRQLTFVCVALETGSFLVNISLYGSLGSHMTLMAMLVALLYRATFDFRIGLWAVALFIGGQVALVGAEAAGWLPSQLAFADRSDVLYASPQRILALAPPIRVRETVRPSLTLVSVSRLAGCRTTGYSLGQAERSQ